MHNPIKEYQDLLDAYEMLYAEAMAMKPDKLRIVDMVSDTLHKAHAVIKANSQECPGCGCEVQPHVFGEVLDLPADCPECEWQEQHALHLRRSDEYDGWVR